MQSPYPTGSVRHLLQTSRVTSKTREVLEERLAANSSNPQFFDAELFAILQAAAARLISQSDQLELIDVAYALDKRLAEGTGDGWRYNTMPPDPVAHRAGLRGLEESAHLMFGNGFTSLNGAEQDVVLEAIQQGKALGSIWQQIIAPRYFEELLAELTETYYSHP